MHKLIVYSLLLLLSSSCSRSMYYAYEDDQSYCTIEATPKRKLWWLFGGRFDQVIYRASSKEHYDATEEVEEFISVTKRKDTKKDNIYIYIKNNNYDVKKEVSIKYWFEMYMLQRNNIYRYDFCISSNDKSPRYAIYNTTEDSLLVDYIRNDLNSEYCFVQQGIDWFPPYLVRIDKIDYSKFNVPEVKYKYLKDPMHRNAPRYDKKWEDEQKKKAKKEEKRKERETKRSKKQK